MIGSILSKNKRSKLTLIASCLFMPSALAETRQFVSLQKTGVVWILPPLASDWQKLKADTFDEGSILRLEPGASIELKQTGRDLSAAEIQARLRLAEPLVARMDRHIFKQLRYKDYALDGLWSEGLSQEKEANSKPLLAFASAYVRHLLSIETAQELPKLKADPEKSTLESAEKINNLIMLAPGQDTLHFLDHKTASVPLYWQSPNDGMSFRIYLWPANDVKREALATVQGNRYMLTVREVGSYRLQVTSSDHLYRSEVIKINVDRALAEVPDDDPLDKQFTKAKLQITAALRFHYPPPEMEIMAIGSKSECLFVWEDRQGIRAGDEYKLVVQGEKSEEYLKVSTQQSFAKIRLPPGIYHYFVMKQNKATMNAPQVSPSQQLKVLDRHESSWDRLGRKAHESLRDSTVLLELR